MKKNKIYSYSKINLSLRIIKKIKEKKLHAINSLVVFAKIYDEISINQISKKKDIIKFSGPFIKNINKKKNTISKTLEVLRENNFLNDKYFKINIKKNIPTQAGLGGGSMNAASLISYLKKKYKLQINTKKMSRIASCIGSDVIIGLKFSNTFFDNSKNLVKRFKNKTNFYLLLVKPNIGCSTELAYRRNKKFSKKYGKKSIKNFKNLFSINELKHDTNDLEGITFKMYPKIRQLNEFLNSQKNCKFSRMTGSGSVCYGVFRSDNSAKLALKKIKYNHPKYWLTVAKTI